MRRRWRPTDSIKAIWLAGLASLGLGGAALAEHGDRSPASAGASNQRGSHSQPAPSQQLPSRLLPPAGLGSAANAPPGFYSRNLSAPEARPSPRRGPAPVYVPYPYPIYVLPPALAVSPSQVIAPPAQDALRVSSPRYAPSAPRVAAPPAPAPQVIVIRQPASVPQSPGAPARERAPPPPPAPPRSTEPAAVSFSIAPLAARVYLDDEFLGTGAELGERQAVLLRPGVYVLEVTHSDYRLQRLVFGVQAGEPVDVAIDLTAERIGRRSRIR